MGEAHREVVSTKNELRRVTGEAQVRTDQAQAALSDAASARNDLQSALSRVQEQSHRTSSLEVHAEKYFQDLTLRHNEERHEFRQQIDQSVAEVSIMQGQNQALKNELAARMSALAESSKGDAVMVTGDTSTKVDTIRLELQESLLAQHKAKIELAEERWESINHAASMEANEARTRMEYQAMMERERSETATYKAKRDRDKEVFRQDMDKVLGKLEAVSKSQSSEASHPAGAQASAAGSPSDTGNTLSLIHI